MPALRLKPWPDCKSFPPSSQTLTAADHRHLRAHAISTWREIAWSIAA
jgi:hypothetical protein